MLLFLIAAYVTFDVTTPHEIAATLLLHLSDTGLIATAAAQQATAVDARTRSVAHPSSCSQNIQPIENKQQHFTILNLKGG